MYQDGNSWVVTLFLTDGSVSKFRLPVKAQKELKHWFKLVNLVFCTHTSLVNGRKNKSLKPVILPMFKNCQVSLFNTIYYSLKSSITI